MIGATNRPQELDDAARRRFVKRLYIPLPEHLGRRQIIQNLMRKQSNSLTEEQVNQIAEFADGSLSLIHLLFKLLRNLLYKNV